MKTYRLDPAKLKEQKRNVILLYGITLIVMMVIYYFMNRGQGFTNQSYLMLGLIVVMFVLFGWNAFKQRQAIWDQYELTVDESGIRQKQPKAADVFLPRADITGTKESKYGLTLMAIGGKPVLGIPKLLTGADYDEVKATVNAWLLDPKPVVLDVQPIEGLEDSPEEELEADVEAASDELIEDLPEENEPPTTEA